MKVFYSRLVATAATAQLTLQVPAGAIIRRVEAHCITLPSVYPDVATGIIDLCTVLESDSSDSSTWLFGQETIIGRQPVSWQGELHCNFATNIWIYFQGLTVGNQVELAVTID